MGGMDPTTDGAAEPGAPALPVVTLSSAGQTYVVIVALLALLSTLTDGRAWYVALVLLTLPLTPVAWWVGFYAGLSVTVVAGQLPGDQSWPVTLVWVAVWSMTAWLNARVLEKVLRRGWTRGWLATPDED